jgi:phage recombination protein Bet
MSDNTLVSQQPTKREEVEYLPLGAADPIRLSVNIIRSYLTRPTRSGAVCDDRQAMKFIMLCKSRGLNPWEGDAFLVGFDGKDGPEFSLITAHQAFLKRAEQCPEFDGLQSGVIVQTAEGKCLDREGDFLFEEEKLLGGWAIVHRKDRRFPAKSRLALKARVKDNKFWRDDPAGMIVKCAEADALRMSFPTKLGGMYLEQRLEEAREEKSPPPAPPDGKMRLRKPAPAPSAEVLPGEEDGDACGEQLPDEPPEEAWDENDAIASADRREAIINRLVEDIRTAERLKDLDACRAVAISNRDILGDQPTDDFLALCDARATEINRGKTRPAKA